MQVVRSMSILALVVPGLALAQAEPTGPPADTPKAGVDVVLAKMSETQSRLKTLSAEFVQEKTLDLLAEPMTSEGHLYYQAPSFLMWEYRQPQPTFLLIDDKTLTAYYPDLRKADRVDIENKRDQFDRFFGMALGADGPMREYFEVELAAETDVANAHLLVLTPRSKRVEKYIAEIRLWVDANTFLPRRFEYREENGDMTTYVLEEVVVNQPLAAETFTLVLPAGVEVTDLAGGFKSRRDKGL